ncbi:SDR family oxidoreductase [Roseicyclus sp. F158]|uniref:SDR family oxidoreductase n=1 Tax=Tropicimonas omnivorans TaxID=3075590 RepID=A0ABU3DBQ3_9RHOB|nr:SDR family oxidoreductase [Roseicyclus sp. F158]MDT0681146.1 SDR family oxidoreductase [Roseicyclus sp. F158]
MNFDLSGKRALVTGSTKGIGHGAAAALLECGAEVIVTGRAQDDVDSAVQRLGAGATGIAADLTRPEDCDRLAREAGRVDILVNNAGKFGGQDFFDTNDADWDGYWSTNVMSGVRLSRALIPAMAERGWGRVIFLSSESAINIPPDMIHYGVTKTAYLALSRGLAKRMAGTGVTVNAVLPGPTLSDGMTSGLDPAEGQTIEDAAADFVKANRPSSVIRRAASVEEVANMIAYVASPLSSATSGASLRVDGGVVDTI